MGPPHSVKVFGIGTDLWGRGCTCFPVPTGLEIPLRGFGDGITQPYAQLGAAG